MFKTVAKILAAVSAAVLLLSGCSTPGPQVAAVVGDTQITVKQVDSVAHAAATTYAQVSTGTVPTWGQLRAPVVNVLVTGRLVSLAMQVAKVQVSEAQMAQLYNSDAFLKALAADPEGAELAQALALMSLAQNSTAIQSAYAQVVGNTVVEVNPQFGVWSSSAGSLTGQTGSLSSELTS